MRKLVKLDANGWLTEIDQKALAREARALRAYIESAPTKEEEIFQYRIKVLPLVEAAISGALVLPYTGDDPYSWRLMLEDLTPMLTDAFRTVYSKFIVRIHGHPMPVAPSFRETGDALSYIPEIVEQDGDRYEWVEFED
jgi:hypothetical protein